MAKYRNYATNTILCAVSLNETSEMVASFAAEVAARHHARLMLQHVIKPQERAEVLAGRTIEDLEGDLLSLIPEKLQRKLSVQAIVGSRRSNRRTPLSGTSAAGRPDYARRARCVGICCHRPIGRGLQGAGPRALPGHYPVARSAGRLRRDGYTMNIAPKSFLPASFKSFSHEHSLKRAFHPRKARFSGTPPITSRDHLAATTLRAASPRRRYLPHRTPVMPLPSLMVKMRSTAGSLTISFAPDGQ